MHKFVRGLITEWRRLDLPFAGETVVAAVSGGADSVSLLLALAELQQRKKITNQIIVAHFDHGLRGKESRADAEFVGRLAGSLGLEFISTKGSVSKKGNLEQNARRARYEFLLKTAEQTDAFAVLTAHTINDQAETFLMNLIRGSGPDGLAAMPPVRPFAGSDVRLIRPLLGWAMREQTEEFCRKNGIEYRTDAMNNDLSFTRVRIRCELIPVLRTYNPKIVETLARTTALMTTNDLVRPNESSDLPETEPRSLSIKDLKELPKAELYPTLRSWIKQFRGDMLGLHLKHIEAIERLIHSRKSGKTVEIPGLFEVQKRSGRLTLSKIVVEK